MSVYHSPVRLSLLLVLVAVMFLVAGCSNAAKEQEIFGNSDAWIQELTEDINITTEYPKGIIQQGTPYLFVIRLENHGEREPHLGTLYVPVDGDSSIPECRVLQPRVSKTENAATSYLFYFPSTSVKAGQTTEIELQCVFSQPGVYDLMISAQFTESTHTFAGIVTTLEVK